MGIGSSSHVPLAAEVSRARGASVGVCEGTLPSCVFSVVFTQADSQLELPIGTSASKTHSHAEACVQEGRLEVVGKTERVAGLEAALVAELRRQENAR